MKKYHARMTKYITIVGLAIVGIFGLLSIHHVDGSGIEGQVTETNQNVNARVRPGHPYAYKLGDAMDIEGSINNYERVTSNQKQIIKAQREAAEAEQLAAKKAEEEKRLEEQAIQAEKELIETTKATQQVAQKATQAPQENTSAATKPAQSKKQPQAEAKPASSQKAEAKPAPAPQPKPEPKKPEIGSNKIGINGNFKSYTNYGRASTEKLQSGIDAGLIVAGLNSFNGNDGATTYFGGHNPGVMNFMAKSIRVGATITVTDSNGNVFNYKMIDKVDVDEYGEGVLKSIGISAIDAYMYGTGSESILIQFCNTNNNLMSFWYGVKI